MNPSFKLDLYRMTGEENMPLVKRCVIYAVSHHIRYVKCYRKYQQRKSFLLRLRLLRLSRKYGLEISAGAEIGEGLYLGHPYNITVASGVKIGKNANLHKGCTIGRENRGKRAGVPTLGDSVYVGINSTVVGKITVGDDVFIAPGAFVNFDVPSHSVVVGNPGVIHHKDNATENYIIHRV
jgi:serine O-acetyltransferase